jgi:branched-chain amino acid transport system permease protein
VSDIAGKRVAAAAGADSSRGPRRALPWLVAAAILLVLPHLATSASALTMMTLMGIAIVFALSYNMLLGQTGLLSFGHAVYYGIGGFLAIHAMNLVRHAHLPVPVIVVPLVGGIAGLVSAIAFGAVSTRRAGTVFAMITLGIGELVSSSALILRGFFGGEEGISTNRTKLFHLFGWSFGPQIQVYYLVAGWCFVAALAMYALTRTPFGRMCNAVRDNEERVSFVGYSPRMVRLIAFSLSGFFAGIAGSLAAINFEIMNSINLGAAQSGIVLLMTFIGGVGSFVGPVIGAILISYLQVMLSDVTEVWQLYFGLLFVGMVMFAPRGIAGLLMLHRPLWRARLVHRMIPAYLIALVPGLVALVGLCLVIEMTYRLLVKASDGSAMQFLRVPLDAATAPPWVAAAVLLVGGFALFRLTWPRVRHAFDEQMGLALQRGVR